LPAAALDVSSITHMTTTSLTHFIVGRYRLPRERLRVSLRPIGEGLESQIHRARVTSHNPCLPRRLIVKTVRGRCRRESTMYRLLRACGQPPPTPILFGVHVDDDAEHPYLEDVHPSIVWPWADFELSAAVCRALAALHGLRLDGSRLRAWDYDLELRQSAEETLQLALTISDATGARYWVRLGDLRRVVDALGCIRTRLTQGGTVLIHGDVPGNVLVRRNRQQQRIVLIDWARSRYGSPLEDLASWLQSVGCWEPEARRRHDSLFRTYLYAWNTEAVLSPGTRVLYWYAAASNGLSGAIRHLLTVLGDPKSTDRIRMSSSLALGHWRRVIRRAAALVSSGSLNRRRDRRPGISDDR
jgi:aminoglycoside phosphotransferase (APT) family kinase protein